MVSIPLFVVVGGVVYIAWRYIGLRLWQMLVSVLLGVLLAATPAGPHITDALNAFTHWVSHL
jgi:hypothetical protein